VIYGNRTPAGALETIERAVGDVWRGGHDAGGLLRTFDYGVDTALVGSGRRPLSASDVAQLKRMLVEAAVALALTGLLALLGSILVMVHAFRAEHRW